MLKLTLTKIDKCRSAVHAN